MGAEKSKWIYTSAKVCRGWTCIDLLEIYVLRFHESIFMGPNDVILFALALLCTMSNVCSIVRFDAPSQSVRGSIPCDLLYFNKTFIFHQKTLPSFVWQAIEWFINFICRTIAGNCFEWLSLLLQHSILFTVVQFTLGPSSTSSKSGVTIQFVDEFFFLHFFRQIGRRLDK